MLDLRAILQPQHLQLVDARDGINYYYFDGVEGISLSQLADMIGKAWSADYQDRAILKFDEDYLQWLMPKGCFFGILATSRDGEIVGCELALDRLLTIQGLQYRASYVTLLSVLPTMRGNGIAQGVLQNLTKVALEVRGSELIVSVFDENAAGHGTVVKFLHLNSMRDWSMLTSNAFLVWAAAPDFKVVHQYAPFKGLARVALLPGVRRLLESHRKANTAHLYLSRAEQVRPSIEDTRYTARMESKLSMIALYNNCDGKYAGEVKLSYASGASSYVAFHMPGVVKPGLPSRRLAQIQMVDAGKLSRRQVSELLRFVNDWFFRAGAICSIVINTVGFSAGTLIRAGFLPTERSVKVAVRGPREVVDRLGDLGGPWLMDIL